jgi:hypothetical protein
MKKLIIIGMLIALSSCGYSVKSDSELASNNYRIEEMQERLEATNLENIKFMDSIKGAILSDAKEMQRFKDSVEFTKLSRIQCYDKNPHRHSCEIYK